MMEVIKKYVAIILGLSCGIIMIAIYVSDQYFSLNMLERLELKTLDYRFLKRGAEQPDDRIVIVGIDQRSLQKIEDPMVFWRPHFAKVIEEISGYGAKSIGLDFVLPIPLTKRVDGLDHDGILANALTMSNIVVLTETFKYEKDDDCYIFEKPIPRFRFAANPNYVGFVNLTNDLDNIVRRQTLFVKDCKGRGHISFGLAVFAKFLDKLGENKEEIIAKENEVELDGNIIPINKYGEMIINFAGPSGTFKRISFYDIWKKENDHTVEYYKNIFKDKIVLIGTTNFLHQDFKPTPFFNSNDYSKIRSTYGIEIWANIINTILNKKYITRLPCWNVLIIILFIGILIGFMSIHLSIIKSLTFVFILVVAYFFICIYFFINNNLWIDIIAPSITIPFTSAIAFTYKYFIENKQKIVIKNLFQHYLQSSVVNELLQNPEKVKLGGTKKELTIFFSDIEGFSTIAESVQPEQLLKMINQYYAEISNVILKYKGTIDQYAGDAIMAFFGAPLDQKNHAELACCTAIETQEHLKDLRKIFMNKGYPPINIRIGINTGSVIVGNVGGEYRFHYTVLGNHVNITARLEAANKLYNTNIIISEQSYGFVKDSFVTRELDFIRVKGLKMPVRVYELLGKKDEINGKTLELLKYFNIGLTAYKNMEWQKALKSFVFASKIAQNDGPTKLYIKRCTDYLKSPPPSNWNGIFIAHKNE